MFINSPHQHASLKPLNFVLWFILAFEAGVINVGGFLSCKRFVTHVTGFATHFGVELISEAYLEALSMLMVPVFFLLGCMTAAFVIDRRKHLKKRPLYTETFFCTGMAFLVIGSAGLLGLLGTFGDTQNGSTIFILLSSLAFLSGVQNSMISLASGLLVRITHLTGITTDLGVGIIRMTYPQAERTFFAHELKMNLLRFVTIFSFILGSIAGGSFFSTWKFGGFLIPAGISLMLSYYSRQFHLHNKQQPEKVVS